MASEEQERIWAQQLEQTRAVFEERVYAAYRLIDTPGKRLTHYQELRASIGDDSARSVAKFTEAIIEGRIEWPKWFKRPRPY